eukprot:1600892-Ditylum_brightwellii.AAC.1
MKKKRQRQTSQKYKKKRAKDNHEKMAEEAKKVISDEKWKFNHTAASFITPHELEAAKKKKKKDKTCCLLPNCSDPSSHKIHKSKKCRWHKFFPLSGDELMAKNEDKLNQSGEGVKNTATSLVEEETGGETNN